jgi:1-acyl-sn-glycerol-3-phosphate acyltransferase
LFRRLADWVLNIVARMLFRLEIVGQENVPTTGPFIALMNHIYFLDPVLVGLLTRRKVIIMSKIENYRILLFRPILYLYGTFPVRRGELDMAAIRTSLSVLERGQGLLMAPEGTRSRTKTLQEGQDGMAWLAVRSQAPLVPVALSGQEQLGHNLPRLRRTPLRVVYGEPFLLQAAGRLTREQRRQMTDETMYRLAALLPPPYRGVYSDLEKATSKYLVPYLPAED